MSISGSIFFTLLKLYCVVSVIEDPNPVMSVPYRSRDVLAKRSMSLVGSHVKQRLCFSKRSRDIMAGLVCIAMVDLGQFLRVADQEESRSDSDNRSCKYEASALDLH